MQVLADDLGLAIGLVGAVASWHAILINESYRRQSLIGFGLVGAVASWHTVAGPRWKWLLVGLVGAVTSWHTFRVCRSSQVMCSCLEGAVASGHTDLGKFVSPGRQCCSRLVGAVASWPCASL